MKLEDMKRGIAYTITEPPTSRGFAVGDVIALASDGYIMGTCGWLDPVELARDERDFEVEVDNDYYLDESDGRAGLKPIPRGQTRNPWDDQLDAIAEASQKPIRIEPPQTEQEIEIEVKV